MKSKKKASNDNDNYQQLTAPEELVNETYSKYGYQFNVTNTDQNTINPDKPYLVPPMLESPVNALKEFPSPNINYKERDSAGISGSS